MPYLGKDETRAPLRRLSDWVVMKLMEPYLGKERNITTDNFFPAQAIAAEEDEHCGNGKQSH